jgi:hypothetical protein
MLREIFKEAIGPAVLQPTWPVAAEQKEPPRYKRGGHWVNLFLLIAGFVVTRPAVWLDRLNSERVY